MSRLFKDKYTEFEQYISKFTLDQQAAIKGVVASDQIYRDIPQGVYAGELSKWVGAMGAGWEELKAKCHKLL